VGAESFFREILVRDWCETILPRATGEETTGSNNRTRISAQLTPVVQQAQTGGKEIVDYAFWKGILLVAVVLVAALIYRFLVARMTTSRSKTD
jgi:hypothetical protein